MLKCLCKYLYFHSQSSDLTKNYKRKDFIKNILFTVYWKRENWNYYTSETSSVVASVSVSVTAGASVSVGDSVVSSGAALGLSGGASDASVAATKCRFCMYLMFSPEQPYLALKFHIFHFVK